MRYRYTKNTKRQKKPMVLMTSYLMVFIGTLILLWSIYPIVAFQIGEVLAMGKPYSPLPKNSLAPALQRGLNVYDNRHQPYYSTYLRDFTKVAQWFPKSPQSVTKRSSITTYSLNVPKIKVTDASVRVNVDDLDRSLVQYGNAVFPGEIGNVVILGHSTLPQLAKNGDYKSIFTYLPSIERGDEIKATVNGFTYTYVVYDMFTVNPSDTWVLDPKADNATLTLITCVPPGTFWKRLIVKANLAGM